MKFKNIQKNNIDLFYMKYKRSYTKRIMNRKRKTKTMKNKKFRRQKGGLIQNMGWSLGGIGFNKQTGAKRYEPTTGKWLNQDCYDVMGFKFCTKPHE